MMNLIKFKHDEKTRKKPSIYDFTVFFSYFLTPHTHTPHFFTVSILNLFIKLWPFPTIKYGDVIYGKAPNFIYLPSLQNKDTYYLS